MNAVMIVKLMITSCFNLNKLRMSFATLVIDIITEYFDPTALIIVVVTDTTQSTNSNRVKFT